MRKIHRAVHFDFHTNIGIYNIAENFDAAVFAERLKAANVDYINFFCQCNRGFAYYPTKVGIKYPGLKGDMFGDILHECHKRDIGVTAYINIGLMHAHQHAHPEWNNRDKEGKIYRDPVNNPNFFRTLCYNNSDFREFAYSLIREICEYDIDGLFCDCMEPFPCLCSHCTEQMIQKGIDITDDLAVLKFGQEAMYEMAEGIKKIVGDDKYLYLNGGPYYTYRNLHTHVELECLPGGHWGYDYFWQHAAYGRNIQKKRIYMTGRLKGGWGDFGGYKGKVSFEHDVFDALCNNYVPSIGDHMHPAENIIADIYKDVGEIFGKVMKYEKYTNNAEFKADIGVITWSTAYLGPEYAGLARILGELHYGYEILHPDMDISRFKLVILPEGVLVNDSLKEKLEKFIADGGKILSTGSGGLRAPKNWPPVQRHYYKNEDIEVPLDTDFALSQYNFEYCGKDTSNSSYYKFKTLPQGTTDMPWSMYCEGILMKVKNASDVRASYIKPYFNKGWDGVNSFFYTPPEKETEYASAVVSGSVAHICFNVFTAHNLVAMKEHKLLVKQLIDELLPNSLVKTEKIPSTARVTLTGTNDYTLLHVKTTYPETRGKFTVVEEHVTQPAGAIVSVRGEYENVSLLPGETAIESKIENGRTIITLPEITGYDMFLLK